MAESDHDELADALAKLASGDVAPSEHEPPAPINPPAKLVQPASLRPAAPQPVSIAPIESRPVRPVAPTPIAVPPLQPAAAALNAPKLTIRPVEPVLRRQRPMAPTITPSANDTEVAGDQSTALSGAVDPSQIIEDDDSVIMPAPDASVFASAPRRHAQATARAKSTAHKNLEFRRTMIPILFTCGLMMLGFASLKFVSGSESSLAALPIWVPVVLVLGGAVVLALAAVNILTVKNQLVKKA